MSRVHLLPVGEYNTLLWALWIVGKFQLLRNARRDVQARCASVNERIFVDCGQITAQWVAHFDLKIKMLHGASPVAWFEVEEAMLEAFAPEVGDFPTSGAKFGDERRFWAHFAGVECGAARKKGASAGVLALRRAACRGQAGARLGSC